MRRLLLTFLSLLPALLAAESDLQDLRALRELQSRAYGSPKLEENAGRPEVALALAELAAVGGGSGSAGLSNNDYDALYSLLQRYRDDLLALGMNDAELDSQLRLLKLRTADLEDRLKKLKPKDGLKIYGRVYTFFDDLHLLGNAAVTGVVGNIPPSPPKKAKEGMRVQIGGTHAELTMAGTRGPVSGEAQMDIVQAWGLPTGFVGARKIYLEFRLPVALQFGDIDLALSPLTLWRNEEENPFEPEPFRSRRQRHRDDLALLPNKWRLAGARVSTDLLLFNRQSLLLESTTAVMGFSFIAAGGATQPVYVNASSQLLTEKYNTYFEGVRAALPFGDIAVLAYNGAIFWDVESTALTGVNNVRPMNEQVHSGEFKLKAGIFKAGAEYALSSYMHHALTTTPAGNAMTGTALTYEAGIQTDHAHLRLFGRAVSSGFHASGAQGRTIDAGFQFLGPFLTENNQVNADGDIGFGAIPSSHASRFNNRLLPPGLRLSATTVPGTYGWNAWQNLLTYQFYEAIDPYGAASPNRSGFGADGAWKLFGGLFKPQASYEAFTHIDAPVDINGNTVAVFTMTRMRAGLDMDLKPTLGWPLRTLLGYTVVTAGNGGIYAANTVSETAYTLNSTLMDAGIEFDFSEATGINFGYRQLTAKGVPVPSLAPPQLAANVGATNTLALTEKNKLLLENQWQAFGFGLWWQPLENLRLDMVYSQWFQMVVGRVGTELEVDQGLMRLTLNF